MGLFDGLGTDRVEELLARAEEEPLAVRDDGMGELLEFLDSDDPDERHCAATAVAEVMAAVAETETDTPSPTDGMADHADHLAEELEAEIDTVMTDVKGGEGEVTNWDVVTALSDLLVAVDGESGRSEADAGTCSEALRALISMAELTPDRVSDELGVALRYLDDPSPDVRYNALLVCRTTVRFGPVDMEGTNEVAWDLEMDHGVVELLGGVVATDPDPEVRAEAADLVRLVVEGALTADVEAARPALTDAMADGGEASLPAARALAAGAGEMGLRVPEAADIAVADGWLEAGEARRRVGARLVADSAGPETLERALPALRETFEQARERPTRVAALEGLAATVSVAPDVPDGLLQEAARQLTEGVPPLQRAAARFVGALAAERPERVEPHVPSLLAVTELADGYDLTEEEYGAVRHAVLAVGELEDERARERLSELATHRDDRISRPAEEVVHKMSEGTTEYQIRHEGQGDVVAGENASKEVSSTEVTDSVVNRSDVGGGDGPQIQHCPGCGESLEEFDPSELSFCPFCGGEL